jgi:hypothetical protein
MSQLRALGENTAMTESNSPADVRVFLLGGFSVVVDQQPVGDRWRLRKAKTLIKLLALAPDSESPLEWWGFG